MYDIVIFDRLDMLVTPDPIAELDHAIADAAARLHAATVSGDTQTARRIAAWIDRRLDERLSFHYRIETAHQPGSCPQGPARLDADQP